MEVFRGRSGGGGASALTSVKRGGSLRGGVTAAWELCFGPAAQPLCSCGGAGALPVGAAPSGGSRPLLLFSAW